MSWLTIVRTLARRVSALVRESRPVGGPRSPRVTDVHRRFTSLPDEGVLHAPAATAGSGRGRPSTRPSPPFRLVGDGEADRDDEGGGEDRMVGGEERPGFVGGSGVEDPMLTDEERVRRTIAAAGGRMRQRELVERSGWTKARVSRLVSAMAEDGVVVKVRVGRENVLCLEEALPAILRDDEGEIG